MKTPDQTKKKMRVGLRQYMKPTPVLMRKVGDGLLGMSSMICGASIISDHKWVALTFLCIGAVGKFMSNFFSNE